MRKAATIGLVLSMVTMCDVARSAAEITSFAGFPAINLLQPGNPTVAGPLTSDFVDVGLRPQWTRAMGDVGGWPTMFEFQDAIYLEFNLVDGHRGTNGPGANGNLIRYRSSDAGNSWELLNGNLSGNRLLGEYVVKGDTLYRYEWVGAEARTAVSTSTDGVNFTASQTAYQSPFWLYGAIYDPRSDKFYAPPHYTPPTADETQRQVHLIESDNGRDWNYVATIHGTGNAESETALHVREDGSMVAMVRQKWGPRDFFLATSPAAPYMEWSSTRLDLSLEGQHFFEVEGQLFLGSRAFLDRGLATPELIAQNAALGETRLPYTLIYKVQDNFTLTPWAVLDSMGDNSYPRAVVTDDEVLITYYSQHQDGVDKVYLAAFDKQAFLAGHLLVPEPASFVLAAIGLVLLTGWWHRRCRRRRFARSSPPGAVTPSHGLSNHPHCGGRQDLNPLPYFACVASQTLQGQPEADRGS